ncbi:MAG: DNA primase [Acidocella sp. 20-57-95]|nr:MAG: DNA primase [Acidocella sp. 20-57-95]OYV57579.1 MAG: DNA primase [Acidocella sp. 21-58-7]HQT64444.1 DNA primase [Acidocella sp.]HQU05437.1 DNA primase [Acidocella sp.]
MPSLPSSFLDELRARTPIAALIGRSVRLTRSGRESKGCCPFHGEKTPSFYVYDDHYHCFGCGEHGDVITFVMKSTGAPFMEAVESLAAEAGLEVPKASPQAAEAEQRRAGIADVLEAAGAQYQKWLFGPEGRAGLDYLRGRGLSEATIKKFGLGWSGEGRNVLASALSRQGITTEQLVEAGLMKIGDRGPVDMFFSRVMFPITDRRGTKISFGGRILGDGQPKYVNGPETAAFSKRRSLYGLNFAREAVRQGQNLIVVEGYMDVIALAQAGFGGAVAPLGTALTDDHLAELWKLSPAPVICFDADNAGRRAAMRTVELALEGLAPDRTLKFLRLPEKEDPDSLIRKQGAAFFKSQLDGALPLSAVLFDMVAEGAVTNTPEGRAALRARLISIAAKIPDKALSGEYRALLLDRFFAERPSIGGKKRNGPAKITSVRIPRPAIDPAAADAERGKIMTAILLNHPQLLPFVEEAYCLIDLPPECADIRATLLAFLATGTETKVTQTHETLDLPSLLTHLHKNALSVAAAQILSMSPLPAGASPEATLAEAADLWWEMFGLMRSSRLKLREQRDEQQMRYMAAPDDPETVAKFIRLNAANARAERAERDSD